jgi:hypothetical protein
MSVDRRLLVLGATLIVAIVAVMVVRSWNDAPVPAAQRPRPAAADRAAATPDTKPPADVNLEALGRERTDPIDANRNPFRFRPKPAPSPPPSMTPLKPPTPFGAQPGGPIANVPTGPPPPPPITLKFIGIVEKKDGTRYAVLSDGKRPISGREGEEIEGRYKILKIGNESLEIAYLDGRGRTQLKLSGQ